MSPELDAAAEGLAYLVGDVNGVVSVTAGKGCIMVQVSNGTAAGEIRSSHGGAYDGHPIVIQKGMPATAGILTLPAGVRRLTALPRSGFLEACLCSGIDNELASRDQRG